MVIFSLGINSPPPKISKISFGSAEKVDQVINNYLGVQCAKIKIRYGSWPSDHDPITNRLHNNMHAGKRGRRARPAALCTAAWRPASDSVSALQSLNMNSQVSHRCARGPPWNFYQVPGGAGRACFIQTVRLPSDRTGHSTSTPLLKALQGAHGERCFSDSFSLASSLIFEDTRNRHEKSSTKLRPCRVSSVPHFDRLCKNAL
jgi:hypothetical protein